MATNFPGSLDAFTNPTSGDTLDNPPHDQQHADVNDAVEAIETALLDGAPLHIDDANERVGIGTTSPNSSLHIDSGSVTNPTHIFTQGYIANGAADTRTGTVRNAFDSNTDFGTYWTSFRGANGGSYKSLFGVRTGGTDNDVLTVDSSGNVGINDTTPSYTLDVTGDINATGDVRVAGNALPRGVVAQGSNTTPANLTTSFQTYVSLTFTGVAGRRYLAVASIGAYDFNNSGTFEAQITNATNGDRYATLLFPIPNTTIDYVAGSTTGTFTATGSNTIRLQAVVFGGATSGSLITTLSSDPQLQIIDIGEA